MIKAFPIIQLGDGDKSTKMITCGTLEGWPDCGAMKISEYKDGQPREYGTIISVEDEGDPLAVIVFHRKETIQEMARQLNSLYDFLCEKEAGE